MLTAAARRAFLLRLDPGAHFVELIGCLPDTNYFVKDAEGHFVLVDGGFVMMLGQSSGEDVLGRTDFDFFPKEVAEKYVADDRKVMRSGVPLRGLVEPVPNGDLTFEWWVANKVPLRDREQKIIGIAGVTSKLSTTNAPAWHDQGIGRVLQLIGQDYRSRLSVTELARTAGLSVRALERTFLRTLNTTPLRYLNRVRLQAARHALVHSNKAISAIAAECGFYDQSHLTAQFTRAYGLSPRRYRHAQAR